MRLFVGLDLPGEVVRNLERLLDRLRPAARLNFRSAALTRCRIRTRAGSIPALTGTEDPRWQSLLTVVQWINRERRRAMPTRNVNLTDELDRFVLAKVKSGRYENASEVVRAALTTFEREEQRQEAKLTALRPVAFHHPFRHPDGGLPTYPAVSGSVACPLGLDQPLGVRKDRSRCAQQMSATGVSRQLDLRWFSVKWRAGVPVSEYTAIFVYLHFR
jgi:putative addiction module CopG family antidote